MKTKNDSMRFCNRRLPATARYFLCLVLIMPSATALSRNLYVEPKSIELPQKNFSKENGARKFEEFLNENQFNLTESLTRILVDDGFFEVFLPKGFSKRYLDQSDLNSGDADAIQSSSDYSVYSARLPKVKADGAPEMVSNYLLPIENEDVPAARSLHAGGLQLDLERCELGKTGKLLVVNVSCDDSSESGSAEVLNGDDQRANCTTKLTGQLFDSKARQDWNRKTAFYNSSQFHLLLFGEPDDASIQCDVMDSALSLALTYPVPQEATVFSSLKVSRASSRSDVARPVSNGSDSGAEVDTTADEDAGLKKAKESIGRLYPVGCTGWIAKGSGRVITAGHCCCDERCEDNEWRTCKHLRDSVLQFNVPKSANGQVRHPDPEHQYPLKRNFAKLHFDGEGCRKIGNDWAVLEVHKNNLLNGRRRNAGEERVGLSIAETLPQGVRRSDALASPGITVTGYRVNLVNRDKHLYVQDEHGQLSDCAVNDTCLKYHETKTDKGMSGAPILVNDSRGEKVVVGIHTDGFPCDCEGPVDAGTSFKNEKFLNAVTGQ